MWLQQIRIESNVFPQKLGHFIFFPGKYYMIFKVLVNNSNSSIACRTLFKS